MAILNRLALFLLPAQALLAQYVVNTRAGTVHFATGDVLIDGKTANWAPLRFPQLVEGQVLATGQGRVEILLGPGVFLRIGERGRIRMLDTRLEDAEVEIQQGTALLEVVEIPESTDVHVVLGPTRTSFRGIGLHRFDAASTALGVFGGHAEVVAGNGRTDATRGTVVRLNESRSVSKFNPRKKDDLLLWAAQRSFDLYISNVGGGNHQTNWEVRYISSAPKNCYSFYCKPQVVAPSQWDHTYYYNRYFDVMFHAGP